MSTEAAYRAVREAAGYWDESDRARIRVTGKDRAKFLQNLLSQDVKALAPGDTAHACALTVKAKLVAEFRVHASADAYLLDVDAERAAPLLEHLRKFVVINQVVFEDVTASTGAVAVEGPKADALLAAAREVAGEAADVARASISGEPGFRLYAERPAIAKALVALARAAGAPPVPADVVEGLRIENGVPRVGAELDENTFPPETGLEANAISATKGCYLGQEPIARLHFLGHVNRHIQGLALPETAPLPARGTKLYTADGKEVGWVTSAARSPALRRPIALAYIRREAAAPGTRLRLGEAADAPADAEVRPLPLVAPTAPVPKPAEPPPPAAPKGPINPGGAAQGGMLMPGQRKP